MYIRNIKVAVLASLRKTAMSLMSLNPSELRPLSLPERKCLSDIITYFLLGDSEENDEKGFSFGERSLSRLASFSLQQNEMNDDVFATVDSIARGINWFMIRRNHQQRIDGPQKEPKFIGDSYVPPDSPALRSLLEFRDVELCHYTATVAKTVVKGALWDSHMSDRCGWLDTFHWHPIQLVGQAASDMDELAAHKVSFDEAYVSTHREQKRQSKLERSASMAATRAADLLDRSDLAAANMVDTSSESEDDIDNGVAPSNEHATSIMRAMSKLCILVIRIFI